MTLWATLALIAAAGPAISPLDRPVGAFSTKGEPRIRALIRFGHENGIRFGIETRSRDLTEQVQLSLPAGRARESLMAVLGQPGKWEIGTRANVILIRRKGVPPPGWLDLRIPRWKLRRTTLMQANLNLWMSTELTLDPKPRGLGGDSPAGDPADLVGPYNFRRAAVRNVLCRILSDSKGGSFVVTGEPVAFGTASVNRLWTLVLYHH